MRLLIICLLAVAPAQCQELKSLIDLCAHPPSTPPKTLSDKVALPDVYKIFGSISDFREAKTSLLVESADKQYRVLEKQSRDSQKERWIQELTGQHMYLFVNVTSGQCIGNATKTQLITNPNFLEVVGNDTSSYFTIIQGLIDFNKQHSGYLLENNQEIVGGINTNKWVSCQTVKNSSIMIEVRYSAEESIRPATSQFSNPLVLSIRLVELANFNSTEAISHISLELDRYDLPVGNEVTIEHGIYCTNKNETVLPLKEISEFSGVLNFFDHATNQSQVLNVLYSKSRKLLTISGEKSLESGVSFIKAPPGHFRNRTNYVVHDFEYGYEFTLSDDSCTSFSPLDKLTSDVLIDANSTVSLKPFEIILVDQVQRFDEYASEINWLGRRIRNFRSYDVHDETIQEVKIDADTLEITEIAIFRSGSRHLGISVTVERTSEIVLDLARISNCYESGKFANNTWVIDLKNKNVTDLKNVGLNSLSTAVVESISKNVYAIIPYRILVFWTQTSAGGLQTMLRIAEKTAIVPAQTGLYNYTAEQSTEDIFKLINQTIYDEKLPLEVVKNDGVKEQWQFNANTITLYPSPSKSSDFLGYTGGAMFVLAIFCLLIGVSIGAVGVFVATRRQRISTLAYQVFE